MIGQVKCDVCFYKGRCNDETQVRLEEVDNCLRFSRIVEGEDIAAFKECIIKETNISYTNYVLVGITPFSVVTHAACTPAQLTMALSSLQKAFEKIVNQSRPMEAAALVSLLLQTLASDSDEEVQR